MSTPETSSPVRELTTITPQTFTHLGGRQASDSLTRRFLARNASTIIFQASLPPETDVPPHGMPAGKFAILTLIHGQLDIALGTEFDPAPLRRLTPGSMALFRPDDPKHYARTGPQGAEILVVAFEAESATDDFIQLLT